MNPFKDNAVSHFQELLERRQKQVAFDRFLVRVARKEDSTEPTDSSNSLSDSDSDSHATQSPSSLVSLIPAMKVSKNNDVVDCPLVIVLPGEHGLPPAESGAQGLSRSRKLQIDESA